MTRSPDLKVFLQLDLNRSTRPGKLSTAHLLLPLLEKFPSRVSVSLFRSPSLRGVLAKVVPPRFNEGWGTWHAKIYGADDEVMISGYVSNIQVKNLSVKHDFSGQILTTRISRIDKTATSTSTVNLS